MLLQGPCAVTGRGGEMVWVSAHSCRWQFVPLPHCPAPFLPQVPVLLTSCHIISLTWLQNQPPQMCKVKTL